MPGYRTAELPEQQSDLYLLDDHAVCGVELSGKRIYGCTMHEEENFTSVRMVPESHGRMEDIYSLKVKLLRIRRKIRLVDGGKRSHQWSG